MPGLVRPLHDLGELVEIDPLVNELLETAAARLEAPYQPAAPEARNSLRILRVRCFP